MKRLQQKQKKNEDKVRTKTCPLSLGTALQMEDLPSPGDHDETAKDESAEVLPSPGDHDETAKDERAEVLPSPGEDEDLPSPAKHETVNLPDVQASIQL